MKPTLGLRYLVALCREGNMTDYVENGLPEYLFTGTEKNAAAYIESHVSAFGVLPAPETIEIHVDVELPATPEPPAYYLAHLWERYMDRGIRSAVDDIALMLKGDDRDANGAVKVMFDRCAELLGTQRSAHLIDFRESYDPIIAAHMAKLYGSEGGVKLGWPSLDEMMGGAHKGDMISYVGRPATGKTWNMLYSACHAWEQQGKVPMFVTFEMTGIMIRERMAALYAHVPSMMLKLGKMTGKGLDTLK